MLDTMFHKCTEVKLMKDGRFEIHCKLGLWCASGTDMKQVEADAKHYWLHYLAEGEYSSLLA